MTAPARKRVSRVEMLAQMDESLRRRYPDRHWDPDVLTAGQVAHVMRCSLDTVRRIPSTELPFSRVGKMNLYLREDVLRYIRSQRVTGTAINVDALLAEIDGDSNVTVLPARKPTQPRRQP